MVVSPAVTSLGAVNVNVTTAGRNVRHVARRSFLLLLRRGHGAEGLGHQPEFWSVRRRHDGDDHRDRLHPSFPHGGLLRPGGATNVTVVSATTITAESPAGTSTVDVTVSTFGETSATSATDVFTYTADGPQVTSVQRYGYHAQPTYLVINFNSPLYPTAAQNVSNYQIVGPGNHRIKVRTAIYNPATHVVTLMPAQRLILRQTYTLKINGMAPSGLTNPEGLLLDGAGNGQPGTDYITSLTESDLAGPASQRPIAAIVKARAKSMVVQVKTALRKLAR